MALTKVRTSATLVRSASARSAADRPCPICISRSTRENSSASGPSVLRATCWTAASKPEAGLDADGEQVDRVRQLPLQLRGRGRRSSGRGTGSARRSRRRCQPMTTSERGSGSRCPASARTPARPAGRPPRRSPCRRSPGRPSSPAGLPARSSLWRIRSLASAPEKRRPILRARAWNGVEDPLGERAFQLGGQLLGCVGHRLQHRQGPVAGRGARCWGSAAGARGRSRRAPGRRPGSGAWSSQTSTFTRRLIQKTPEAEQQATRRRASASRSGR